MILTEIVRRVGPSSCGDIASYIDTVAHQGHAGGHVGGAGPDDFGNFMSAICQEWKRAVTVKGSMEGALRRDEVDALLSTG
jgi:hypothetical protein